MAHGSKPKLPPLPGRPIDPILEPFGRFLHIQTASGIVLLVAAVAAFILANSAAAEWFNGLWKTKALFGLGEFTASHSLKHWINDGLMVIFFFVVGLEVKREIVLGQLRDMKQAALPIAAALGGMVLPAGIYLALQAGEPAARGWGIPMATDIAFVVGCMALLGPRVPSGLRVLLLSLAIADDIGAILVIAIGYTTDLNMTALALGAAGIGLVWVMQKAGVRSILLYVVVGVATWLAFHESGVHATVAGVILGLMTPARHWISTQVLAKVVEHARGVWEGEDRHRTGDEHAALKHVAIASNEAIAPLDRLERALHPWSAFCIMPIFALANAGVAFETSQLVDPVAVAVAAGLVLGKPVGIVLFSFLAVKMGLARLPAGVSWGMVVGGGCLAGIGFTMALFIASLALEGPALEAAKMGVLGGSIISGALGMTILWLMPQPKAAEH